MFVVAVWCAFTAHFLRMLGFPFPSCSLFMWGSSGGTTKRTEWWKTAVARRIPRWMKLFDFMKFEIAHYLWELVCFSKCEMVLNGGGRKIAPFHHHGNTERGRKRRCRQPNYLGEWVFSLFCSTSRGVVGGLKGSLSTGGRNNFSVLLVIGLAFSAIIYIDIYDYTHLCCKTVTP